MELRYLMTNYISLPQHLNIIQHGGGVRRRPAVAGDRSPSPDGVHANSSDVKVERTTSCFENAMRPGGERRESNHEEDQKRRNHCSCGPVLEEKTFFC